MIKYLQEENRILRARLPTRITLSAGERNRLVKHGTALGELIAVVSYSTLTRWAAGVGGQKIVQPAATRKPDRPRTAPDIRKLVAKLATENGWGYTRILGELKKLGVTAVSRFAVANVLKAEDIDPGPGLAKARGPISSDGTQPRCRRATWSPSAASPRAGSSICTSCSSFMLVPAGSSLTRRLPNQTRRGLHSGLAMRPCRYPTGT